MPLDTTDDAMTVEVYKPTHKSRPAKSVPTRPVMTAQSDRRTVIAAPARQDTLLFTPVPLRMDLVIGIEEMTHPDRPSFAELEALVMTEDML